MSPAILTTATTPWWWDSASNLTAVLIGALISSIISFMIANRSSKEVLRRDDAERSEKEKAAIARTSLTLVDVMSEIQNLRQYLSSQLSKRTQPGRENAEDWELVMPRLGHIPETLPEWDGDGLMILFAANHLDLVQKMILLRRRVASANIAFEGYCARREALKEKMPPPVAFDGPLGRVLITDEQQLALRIYTIPLNDIIKALLANLDENWAMAKSVVEEFTEVARKHLRMPGFTLQFAGPETTTN